MSGPRTPAQPLVPPSVGAHLIVDLSRPHVLHLILNRPKQLNAMTDVSGLRPASARTDLALLRNA
jgi:hypothetical protein